MTGRFRLRRVKTDKAWAGFWRPCCALVDYCSVGDFEVSRRLASESPRAQHS